MYNEQRGSSPESVDLSKLNPLKKEQYKGSEIGEKERPTFERKQAQTLEEKAHKKALDDRALETARRSIEKKGKTTPEPRFEKLLENIEIQIAQQREEIVLLQSVYDKAWFGRGKKLQELEAAKTKRTELLKKRNEVRKEAGMIDIGDHLATETTTENKLEKLLGNIETQLAQQREEIVRLQSIYDRAWFGRGEKLKRLEEAKTRRTDLLKKRNEVAKKVREEEDMNETIKAEGIEIKTYIPDEDEEDLAFRRGKNK